jgi:pyruvate formate lyase activating enzyme
METRRPLIVEVKRDSRDDGPGIRTVVFFKGCPLRCVFCQNPETQAAGPEVAFAAAYCVNCGACAAACGRGAIDLLDPARINRNWCDGCGDCAAACRSGAMRAIGTFWPVEQLAEFLRRDAPFYRHSGGGVTLSGGECTMFPDYLSRLLEQLRVQGIHVALETCGEFDYDVLAAKILPHVDLILFDLKVLGTERCERFLQHSDARILSNLRALLAQNAVEVQPRVPLVPGVTSGRENLAEVIGFLGAAGARSVAPLPYNPLGLALYTNLGRPTPAVPCYFSSYQEEREALRLFHEIVAAHFGGTALLDTNKKPREGSARRQAGGSSGA